MQVSHAPFWELTFIATASRALPDSVLLPEVPKLSSEVRVAYHRVVDAPKNCHQEPDTATAGGKWICTGGSFPPQYTSTYRAWCYMFQHVDDQTPDLDISGGQAILFFSSTFRKTNRQTKTSTEKGQ